MSYRVVAEIAGRWQQVDARFFAAGEALIDVAGATEVELLVDRRPGLPVPEPAVGGLLLAAGVLAFRRRRVA